MKFKSKKLTLISIIMIVAGLIISVLAFIAAKGKIGVYLDSSGIHYAYAEGSGSLSDAYDLADFQSIDVTYADAEVTLCASDHYGISYENVFKNNMPKVDVVNKKLSITRPDAVFISLINFNFKRTTIVIYYPEGSDFSEADLSITSGKLSISDLKADILDLSVVDGHLEISDIEAETITLSQRSASADYANIKADRLTFSNIDGKSVFNNIQIRKALSTDVKSGKLELNSVMAEYLGIKAADARVTGTDLVTKGLNGSGFSSTFDLAGDFNGDSNLSNADGKIIISLSGNYMDYNYNLKTTDGSIRINGEKQSVSVTDNNNAENNINIDQTSGKIQIESAE